MIVDIHAHTFPDELAPRAIAQLAACGQIPPHTDGTCAGLAASMARAGIDISIIAPVATKPTQAHGINTWITAMSAKYPTLVGLGALHPQQSDWPEEIAWLIQHGVPGAKLHPDYQGFFIDDPALLPLLRTLADMQLVLLLHCGVDIGLPPPVHCPPERLARMLDAVPGLTVIAAHMGGFRQWEAVERLLAGRDRLYLDTSYSLPELGAEGMVRLIRAHGPTRVLFGTDSPWANQAEALAAFRALPLTPEEHAAILGGNAERLLGDALRQQV